MFKLQILDKVSSKYYDTHVFEQSQSVPHSLPQMQNILHVGCVIVIKGNYRYISYIKHKSCHIFIHTVSHSLLSPDNIQNILSMKPCNLMKLFHSYCTAICSTRINDSCKNVAIGRSIVEYNLPVLSEQRELITQPKSYLFPSLWSYLWEQTLHLHQPASFSLHQLLQNTNLA